MEKWKKNAQKGEFEFHKTNEWRNSEKFIENTILLLDSFGFNRNEYDGRYVLDLGTGSKLRCKYFENASWVVIEPMADDCIKEIPWSDLTDAEKVFSCPAEKFVPDIEDSIDFIMSNNALDHCYDFDDIVENVYRYLKSGGLAFLSFDAHFTTNKMHPLILTQSLCEKKFKALGFAVEKMSRGFEGQYKNSETYGHGSYCLNFWLRK